MERKKNINLRKELLFCKERLIKCAVKTKRWRNSCKNYKKSKKIINRVLRYQGNISVKKMQSS